MLYIGSHVSFKKDSQLLGSLMEALSYGATTFMFYTGAPQNTARYPINDELTLKALEMMKQKNIDYRKVIVHAPYIINLANSLDQDKYKFSIRFLSEEIDRCSKLGITNLVLHPGSHVGSGESVGIRSIVYALNQLLTDSSVTILLETMAGKGTEIGKTFEEIKEIIDGVNNKDKIGVCLDTCHMNDSGYDITNFDEVLDEFDKIVGLKYVKCIHINDSKNIKGAKKDRHENFGFGNIGFYNLIKIVYNERLKDVPKILETPYVDRLYPPYFEEIEMIKNKKFDKELIEKIRNNNKKSK